ncbi:SrtB family sortase [Paraliobacillus quinghaiensis]|uniref:SrtB family sortase n=1 Tax=Paraliobacillus quinghaiensis TaxID=470815 RepID=A0A917TWA1_9BACI|nr:class B sortase [Paraliobacillus quinghaiensis]GGM38695.1 SrtB family sortase [Paraliobacillus quinghaiensis]
MGKLINQFKQIIKNRRNNKLGKNHKSLFYRLAMFICVIVFAFSCFMIGKDLMASIDNKNTYNSIQETFYEDTGESTTKSEDALESDQGKKVRKEVMSNFQSLLEINPSTVGWIRISNTPIDYPVVQGANNDYYLRNNFKNEKNKAGSIFMDYRNSPNSLDRNTIIYGHHMKDGSMFAGLTKYKEEEFLLENPVIVFNSKYEELHWEIFSVYVTDTDFNYIKPDFETDVEFEGFLQTVKEKSLFSTDVDVNSEDKILTLSTCVYDFDDARLVVQAKLIEN